MLSCTRIEAYVWVSQISGAAKWLLQWKRGKRVKGGKEWNMDRINSHMSRKEAKAENRQEPVKDARLEVMERPSDRAWCKRGLMEDAEIDQYPFHSLIQCMLHEKRKYLFKGEQLQRQHHVRGSRSVWGSGWKGWHFREEASDSKSRQGRKEVEERWS